MQKTILYPFEPQLGNASTFNLAVTLARKLDARVILFTVLPEDSTREAIDQIFLHLLGLLGDYRARHQSWHRRLGICFERIIHRGSFDERLRALMCDRQIDILICQPHNIRLNQGNLRKKLPPNLTPELVDLRSWDPVI